MNHESIICSECESGTLVPTLYADTFLYNGKPIEVAGLEKYVCEECGADPIYPFQMRHNEKLFAEAKRNARGRPLLSGDQVKRVREVLGLTQLEAALYFGGGTNAFSKYEREVVVQSEAMDRLIRVVDRYPFLLDDLRELSGHPPKTMTISFDVSEWVEHAPMVSEAKSTKFISGNPVVAYFEDYKQRKCA